MILTFSRNLKEEKEEEHKEEEKKKQDFCEWFAYKYRFQILFAFFAANAYLSYNELKYMLLL
jgi:hypothetical protein